MSTVCCRWIAALLILLSLPEILPAQKKADELGVGMVRPVMVDGAVLRFYSTPGYEQTAATMEPVDSVVFKQGQYNIDIGYAPPWLAPEFLNLGYEIFMMRARTLRQHWVEVVVNTKTNETRWVERTAVEFNEWSTFLLSVFAVETYDPKTNPVRSAPDNGASVVLSKRASLLPLEIRGSWMRVSNSEPGDPIVPTGWIRWRDGDRLIVRFSPLS